jgi:Domain of unknown function (DUF4349)
MRTIRSLPSLIVIVLAVAACAGSATTSTIDTGATGGEGVASNDDPRQALAPEAPGGKTSDAGPIAAVDDAKIIRTGTMSLDVTDVPAALRAARDAITALGGYIGASTTSSDGDRPTAEVTYRIPVARWEAALDALRSLNGLTSRVVAEHTDAIEVTSQIVDLDARIANLRASETALQAIAAQATKISDVLEVQARLTDTRGQIESLAAQRKDLSDRAAYSALTVRFDIPVVAVAAAASGWDPGMVVDSASATMVSLLQSVATAGIWFAIVWLPILAAMGVLTAALIILARRAGLRRRVDEQPPTAAVGGEG